MDDFIKFLSSRKAMYIIAALLILYVLYWIFSFVIEVLLYIVIAAVIFVVLKKKGIL